MATQIPDYEFTSYLREKGFQLRERGAQLDLQFCPYCESASTVKSHFAHFSFHREKQVFNCMKCNARGTLYKFKLDQGDINPITRARGATYKRPAARPEYTAEAELFYAWYEAERGIKAEILKRYQVGQTDRDDKRILIYQFFNENKELVNRKYRSADKTMMWTEKDAERTYYGLQFIDFSKKYLHICEGEDDCHALIQLGFDNVVSVPYGAGNYSQSMDRVNAKFADLILLFDCDEKGQDGARKFAEKAGLTKCRNVVLPFKDARDCMREGLDIFDIQKEIAKAKVFRHASIIKAGDARDEFNRYVTKSEQLIGRMTKSPTFNKIVGGIRLGEMTVITGHSGSGKSTFAFNFAAWCEEIGYIPMVFSFENKIGNVIKKFIEIYSKDSLHTYDEQTGTQTLAKDEAWRNKWTDVLNDKLLYFFDKRFQTKDGYFTVEKMEEVVEYAVKFYNVNVFVVDHLHYFMKFADARNPVGKIDETVRLIKNWGDRYNAHIVLIVHPHQTQDSRTGKPVTLGMNSTKGASSIFQEAANFWVISRPAKKAKKEEQSNAADPEVDNDKLEAKLSVLKNRELGTLGDVYFQVLQNRNTFEPKGKTVERPPEAVQQKIDNCWWDK